jgi:hypothetical protein
MAPRVPVFFESTALSIPTVSRSAITAPDVTAYRRLAAAVLTLALSDARRGQDAARRFLADPKNLSPWVDWLRLNPTAVARRFGPDPHSRIDVKNTGVIQCSQ